MTQVGNAISGDVRLAADARPTDSVSTAASATTGNVLTPRPALNGTHFILNIEFPGREAHLGLIDTRELFICGRQMEGGIPDLAEQVGHQSLRFTKADSLLYYGW